MITVFATKQTKGQAAEAPAQHVPHLKTEASFLRWKRAATEVLLRKGRRVRQRDLSSVAC